MYCENYEKLWYEKWQGNCSRGNTYCYCSVCKEDREYENARYLKYKEESKSRKEIRDWNNYLRTTLHPW